MNGANSLLYDFINQLNDAFELEESEFNEDFDSQEFMAVDREINDRFKTKITVLEDEFIDYNDKPLYSYIFGLQSIGLDEIDGYNFDRDEVIAVIKNYSEKIKSFAKSQKEELEKRLNALTVFAE
jgi:BMFP domain-containing protein YqiC